MLYADSILMILMNEISFSLYSLSYDIYNVKFNICIHVLSIRLPSFYIVISFSMKHLIALNWLSSSWVCDGKFWIKNININVLYTRKMRTIWLDSISKCLELNNDSIMFNNLSIIKFSDLCNVIYSIQLIPCLIYLYNVKLFGFNVIMVWDGLYWLIFYHFAQNI